MGSDGHEWKDELAKFFKAAIKKSMKNLHGGRKIIVLTLEDVRELVNLIEKYLSP